ncbi:MAG: type IV pili twitching motility protein PilT [Candidatus Vogelbacteria bacterium GWA1_51_14]|uniref:Type IV pili twitching motility protein PilT n=1 Tax=Candidatus Vogelbacteria bacterium GWA1_51_14 TaxID=1802435 RepID=A0A1G2QCG9_9BACT|nr:MAG: type IV pili twitching motility protein PilT [Candidatus Vogelbacteria bacterium GWA1_51_14]
MANLDYQREIAELVGIVIKEGASDLHLTAGRHPTVRVSGDLIPLVNKPVFSGDDVLGFVMEILNEENRQRFLKNKEIDFSWSPDPKARFRGNAFYQQGQVSAAFRLIPTQIKTLKELNLPDLLSDFARRQQGFFLVVGPVGQGKTTTLAAMIQLINQERTEHIITIEDPIEYLHQSDKSIIDQREVRFDTTSFASGLHSMFRQDVDVAMIGEMRDPDTMATAVTAAETGHLIFSTLHTNSASQTIDRIIDSFPANQQKQIRIQLSSSLLGIFSQRLVPRVAGGRIPAYELLINTAAVANLIREGRTAEVDVLIETGSEQGMINLNSSLVDLVRRGEISAETAYQYSLNPKGLEKMI